MSFQTSFLRDGEWVTETVNIHDALQASVASKPSNSKHVEDTHIRPSPHGLLVKTVIESPVARWILPARIRTRAKQDVAYVGDNFVTISELHPDGQLQDIARTDDIGARIRRAVVIGGATGNGLRKIDHDRHDDAPRTEHDDPVIEQILDDSPLEESRVLPPQILALVLETGDFLFLFLKRGPKDSLEFVVTRYSSPKKLAHLGYHFAIDPTSRFMAAATLEGFFAVYELESMQNMSIQYALHGCITPITSCRFRSLQGMIHAAEFLFARNEDINHFILLLIVTRHGRSRSNPTSRLVYYEWEKGESLEDILAEDKVGNVLPTEHGNPIFVIPLRLNHAFITVTEQCTGIVKEALSGCPRFESFVTGAPGPTKMHQGSHEPLWTAWARPFRLQTYFEKTDVILLGREDGVVAHIEIDARNPVPTVTSISTVDANIDTAFTSAYDVFADIILISGDSGPGVSWKLEPREKLNSVIYLPNWSPVVDMAIIDDSVHKNKTPSSKANGNTKAKNTNDALRKPHRLFSISGRARTGCVTEWRRGIQAQIGLEIDIQEAIKEAWAFYLQRNDQKHLYSLLALPESTIVLQFTTDLGDLQDLSLEENFFDASSRTLFATELKEGTVLQVSECWVVLVSETETARYSVNDLFLGEDLKLQHAFCANNDLVVSFNLDRECHIYMIRLDGMSISKLSQWAIPGEVTCLSAFHWSGDVYILSGCVFNGQPLLSVYTKEGDLVLHETLKPKQETSYGYDTGADQAVLEPLTGICVLPEQFGAIHIVSGTRCGHLITLTISLTGPKRLEWSTELISVAPVEVFPASDSFHGGTAIFVCCDNNVMVLSDYCQDSMKFTAKSGLWFKNLAEPAVVSPPVHSLHSLRQRISKHEGHMSILALSGSKLLLAEMVPQLGIGLVPRSIPVEGTPTRIIYSKTCKCLVIALLKDNRSALAFVDPESGNDISSPVDKNKNSVDHVSGLGHEGDRIYGLHEWLYVKDGRTFAFILVTTRDGRLLIVSMNREQELGPDGPVDKLQFWTRYKKKFSGPIYSIVGDSGGLVFCVDRTLHWNILSLTERKLKHVKEYDLDSPATSLRIVEDKVLALTTNHSLEVVDYKYGGKGEMTLVYTDQVSRRTVHMVDVPDSVENGLQSSLTFLSDHTGTIAGVGIPWGQGNREFDVLFETRLLNPVRRFVSARTRPLWSAVHRGKSFGVYKDASNANETLGVSMNGTLVHFTLLTPELWQFLRLVQNLANESPLLYPSAQWKSLQQGPDGMLRTGAHVGVVHIDGDMLERCLKLKALAGLVWAGNAMDLFCNLLDRLEEGRHTEAFRTVSGLSNVERFRKYLALGYEVLEFLTAPVL